MMRLRASVAPRSVSLIVIESQAPWPGTEIENADLDADRLLLAQQTGEGHLDFSRRVMRRIRGLVEHGTSVRLGVISVGARSTSEADAGRYRIARALLAARSNDASADLVLVANGDRGPRHDLLGLTDALAESLGGGDRVRLELVETSAPTLLAG